MSRSARLGHEAFSLLEVIIATAILAGSAMVLFSLIALGSKYGNRAEERTIAIAQAQSIMDEFIARMPNGDLPKEEVGVLPCVPPRHFRIEVTPFEFSDNIQSKSEGRSSSGLQTNLYRVHVKLLASAATIGMADTEPLCDISRLVRRPRNEVPMTGGRNSEKPSQGAKGNRTDREMRGGFQ